MRRGYGKDPYHKIGGPGGYLENLEGFTGNSMWAEWEDTYNTYRVYSYSTLMAIFDPEDGTLFYNDNPYSPTTSRHQTLIRAWTGRWQRNYEVVSEGASETWHAWETDRKSRQEQEA